MVALGGNAIKQPHERGTAEEQMRNVRIACSQISELVKRGHDLIITHGNGPQVGNLAIQQEQAMDMVPAQPLVVLGAMTQGQIGYMIQQNLRNLLEDDGFSVATVVTQVLVDRDSFVVDSRVLRSIPRCPECTASAIDAARAWRFEQPVYEGEAVQAWVTIRFGFHPAYR